MKATCPHCHETFESPATGDDKPVTCPACGKAFTPTPDASPTPDEIYSSLKASSDSDEEILPEGGIFLRIFAVGFMVFAVVGIVQQFTNPYPWLLLLGGMLLFALGLIVNHLKRIELHLRPENRQPKS